MKPQYLNLHTSRHIMNGITRVFTYDLPYSLGDTTCKLLRIIHAIEDFVIDDCFHLRPIFACDIQSKGMVHIKFFHVHIIIQPRGYHHEHERRLQIKRIDGLPDNEE